MSVHASWPQVKYAATTSEMSMAATSVHAEMRHQNQRSKNSPPVPAPSNSNKLNACPASVRVRPKPAPITSETPVATCPATTRWRSEASGRMNLP